MSKSAIRSSINHYEAKINEEYNFINKCEDEIFDLEICYKRIDNAESKHNNEQARRITVLKRFEGKNKTIKIARIYSEQMSNLIAGEENNRMVDCFEDAKRLASIVCDIAKPKELLIMPHEPMTGAHVGPGMLGLFYEGKRR